MDRENINLFSAEEIELYKDSIEINSRQSFVFVFVKRGEGYVQIDDYQFSFKCGKLFFINAIQHYNFVSDDATLTVIKCPLNFIDRIRAEADRIETCDNLYKLNYIANNFHSNAGCIFRDQADLSFANFLIDNIVREFANSKHRDLLIIRQSIAILLNLIARNLIKSDTKELEDNRSEFLVMKIIGYIQQNIKELKLIKVESIAQHFGLSKTYFGEFFKKNIGVSFQSYLLDYRLSLVETRLLYSNMRLKEIADELNFSDESHLSKIFKKHRGICPSNFRKDRNQNADL